MSFIYLFEMKCSEHNYSTITINRSSGWVLCTYYPERKDYNTPVVQESHGLNKVLVRIFDDKLIEVDSRSLLKAAEEIVVSVENWWDRITKVGK